jgi:hypothetical protein
MKLEITEYDDGKACLAFEDTIVTECLGDFYHLAPDYKIPENCTVLDPLIDSVYFKDGKYYFNGVCLDKLIVPPKGSEETGYRVLLLSGEHKEAKNFAHVVEFIFSGDGEFKLDESNGEIIPC